MIVPRVSVIVPTSNRSALLRRAVGSILAQTLGDFEIIIVDDASIDDTQQVVKAFGDDKIRYVRHHAKKGAAAARNTGIVSSRGKYIAFLDDDDEWFPEKLAKQFDLLERRPPTVGVVYTGAFAVDAATGKVVSQQTPTRKGNVFNDIFVKNSIAPTSTFFVRKECFAKVGLFDVGLEFGEDFDMWLRIANEYQFDCIEEPLIKFSLPDNKPSLSSTYDLMIRGNEARLKKYAPLFALHRRSHSRRYFDIGILHCYNGNVEKGREAFIRAIKKYPFEIKYYLGIFLSFLGPQSFRKIIEYKESTIASLMHSLSK